MHFNKPLSLCALLTIWLTLSGSHCELDSGSSSTKADSEQKISDTAGNFGGNLSLGDQFGSAITELGDLEGDGVTDLAIGAPFDDDNGSDRGAVWILFMDDDGRVDMEQKISEDEGNFAGDLGNDDNFGSAVAGIGDLDGDGVLDLAVGAPLDDDGGLNRGAIWILFLETDGTVREFQKISEEAGGFTGNLDSGDRFGSAIANIGDLDGDGVNDLAVGANQDNDGGIDKGAIWILFMNTDGTVKATQKISEKEGEFNGNLNINDQFGSAVAGIGDLDGNGVNDLAVGANLDNDGGPNRGAVWILFLKDDGTVDSEQKISQSKGNLEGTLNDEDQFGSSVASIGDLDDDGVTDLVVGANQSDDGGSNRGAIWILFMEDDGTVKDESIISSTAGNFGGSLDDDDQFGSAVADIGDLNNDGVTDIAVGAPLDDDGGIDNGATWIIFLREP